MTDAPSFHISVNARRSNRESWGDTQYAQGLAAALERGGASADLFFRDESPGLTGRNDIVLRITGPHLEEPVEGLPNLLWIISPPHLAPLEMLRRYQHIFSASRILAYTLQKQGLEATYLPQATSLSHFHPDKRASEAPELPVTFVGAYAERATRRIVQDAIRAGYEVNVWGPGWDGVIPGRMWRGQRLTYDELAEVYARSRVILNSHMQAMAMHGFMSNRSLDAIAAGAVVVSDRVRGFRARELPDLTQVRTRAELVSALDAALGAPLADRATRVARHDRVAAQFGFDSRAGAIVVAARAVLADGGVSPAAFARRGAGFAPRVHLTDPAQSADTQPEATLRAAREVRQILAALEFPGREGFVLPSPIAGQGVIHAMMSDLRRAQALARDPEQPGFSACANMLAARARRVAEAMADQATPFPYRASRNLCEVELVSIMQNAPLWVRGADDYSKETQKPHARLWPRNAPPVLQRPVGVFLHLFHDDLAARFAERMTRIEVPFQLYVSTDTEAKAAGLRRVLPEAEVRVLPNRGRDIYPKFFGFGDAHAAHDLVLHLHGKKSLHSGSLHDWLEHNLECLLPSAPEVNRILSLFESIPALGLVTPLTFRAVLNAAHWGANFGIAEELAFRMGLEGLPGNDRLRFPVGSMFWGRVRAIRPVLDLALAPGHFPPEAGQVDGTLAHAIERMIGVACIATGHRILPVVGGKVSQNSKFRRAFTRNGALRQALEAGAFDA